VRVDDGVQSGDEVTIHYDPLLAKICTHGPDRATAVRRLRRALATAVLLGPITNLPFLRDVVAHNAFAAGEVHTDFLAEHFSGWQAAVGDAALALKAAALIRYGRLPQQNHWRNNPTAPLWFPFALDDAVQKVWLWPQGNGRFKIGLAADGVDDTAVVHGLSETAVDLTLNGVRRTLAYVWRAGVCAVQTPDGVVVVAVKPRLPAPAVAAGAGGSLRAPMPGVVLAVLVAEGDEVAANQPLLKLEAMKMEHTIRSAAAGVVEAIHYRPGDTVEADVALLGIRPL
jgi:acetyl/propionyl-CoA carboxylase alpha subunit